MIPNFEFHHARVSPYEVVEFEDDKGSWDCLLAKGFRVRLQKDDIIRIEPTNDPSELRTWYDREGKHSVVARFVSYEAPTIKLRDIDSQPVSINANLLSEYDQKHVYFKILHPSQPLGE